METRGTELTAEKCKDSGLALVLICLICHQVWAVPLLLPLAIAFLLVAMTYPLIFRPFGRFWFVLSTGLGTVMSKIILSLLFYAVVLPVGLLRRAIGKDSMKIRAWKQGMESVFRVREHRFEASDLKHPY